MKNAAIKRIVLKTSFEYWYSEHIAPKINSKLVCQKDGSN